MTRHPPPTPHPLAAALDELRARRGFAAHRALRQSIALQGTPFHDGAHARFMATFWAYMQAVKRAGRLRA